MATKRTDVAARVTAETSAFERGTRRVVNASGRMATKVEGAGRRMRAALRNTGMGNVASRFRGIGMSIAGFAGVYGIGQAIHSVREFEDSLEDLRRFGRMGHQWMNQARKAILGVSDETGVAKDQLAAFAAKFVELTGDAKGAMAAMRDMAKVSVATGAGMTDLAAIMELLSGTFNVKGAKAMSMVLGKMAKQALMGTMSFKNIAQTIGEVGGVYAAQLGVTGEKGATDIAALMQLGIRVARTPDVTKTGALRFGQAISEKYKKFEELTGVSLKKGEKFKSLGEMTKIIAKAFAEAAPEKREKMYKEFMPDVRGKKILAAITQAYRVGWTKKQGAWAAPSALFAAKGKEGGRSIIDVMYGEAAKAPGQKIRRSMAQITNQIHRTLLPAFKKLAENMGWISKVAMWAVDNIKGLAAAWAVWKGAKIFQAMKTAGGALAQAGGGAGPVATMTVQATTVNVMGGGPGGGGRGGVAPMPSGTRELGGAPIAPKPGDPKFIGPQRPGMSDFDKRAYGGVAARAFQFIGPAIAATLAFDELKREAVKVSDKEQRGRAKRGDLSGGLFGGAQSALLWGRTPEQQSLERESTYERLMKGADIALSGAGLKQQDPTAILERLGSVVEKAIRDGMQGVTVSTSDHPSDKVNQGTKTGAVR